MEQLPNYDSWKTRSSEDDADLHERRSRRVMVWNDDLEEFEPTTQDESDTWLDLMEDLINDR
jgi:hypothetical protein